jgi:hypothetical protein
VPARDFSFLTTRSQIMADEEIRRIPGLDNGVLRLPAIPFGKHGGIAAGTAGEMYMHRRIQLALAAGVVSALGILVPVEARAAASRTQPAR